MQIVERLIVAKDMYAREKPMLRDTLNDAANMLEHLYKREAELYGMLLFLRKNEGECIGDHPGWVAKLDALLGGHSEKPAPADDE